MPNGPTHRRMGALAGGVAALYHARDEPLRGACLETLGGVFGGVLGSMLPDRLDPPTSPRHRGAYHSVLLLIALSQLVLETQRSACRARAHKALRVGLGAPEPTFASDAWLFASGFITGVQWGYLSHLGADLMTGKAGLPLLVQGF